MSFFCLVTNSLQSLIMIQIVLLSLAYGQFVPPPPFLLPVNKSQQIDFVVLSVTVYSTSAKGVGVEF